MPTESVANAAAHIAPNVRVGGDTTRKNECQGTCDWPSVLRSEDVPRPSTCMGSGSLSGVGLSLAWPPAQKPLAISTDLTYLHDFVSVFVMVSSESKTKMPLNMYVSACCACACRGWSSQP